MKKTTKFLSIAAFALVGTLMMGCNELEDTQPIEQEEYVTLKITVGREDSPQTRALSPTGVKTFAAGEKIAVVYQSSNFGRTSKVVSEELTNSDIENEGKTATFTINFPTNKWKPDSGGEVRIIYPAFMAKESISNSASRYDDNATINYDALKTQDGTLTTLASNLDLAVYDGTLNETSLPTKATLTNRLTICAYTLKDNDGSTEITSKITQMVINDGTYSYSVNRSAIAGPIYVAMRPTASASIQITSTTGAEIYTKSLSDKTYKAGNGYNLSLRMTRETGIRGGFFSINNSGKMVCFSPGNLQATYDADAVGEKWTWRFAAHQYDYIGDASGNKIINGTGTLDGDGTVDLFFSSNTENSYGIAVSSTSGSFSDWGNIDIDGNGSGYWRSLTGGISSSEWSYLIRTRSGNRFTQAEINTDGTPVKGVILFPDGFTCDATPGVSWGTINGNSDFSTVCTSAGWAALENVGCVFLPAAGKRKDNDGVPDISGSYGLYLYHHIQTSTESATYMYRLRFNSSGIDPHQQTSGDAGSVRLVHEVN